MKASISQLSTWTGFDRRTVSGRLHDLPSTPGPRRARLYESRDALRLIYAGSSADGSLNSQQERAALDKVRRLILEEQRRERSGELISADEVRERWQTVILRVRSRLLAMPTKLAGLVAHADQRTVYARTEELLHEALNELAGDS
jgi:hypothetical protein